VGLGQLPPPCLPQQVPELLSFRALKAKVEALEARARDAESRAAQAELRAAADGAELRRRLEASERRAQQAEEQLEQAAAEAARLEEELAGHRALAARARAAVGKTRGDAAEKGAGDEAGSSSTESEQVRRLGRPSERRWGVEQRSAAGRPIHRRLFNRECVVAL
jgi:predicted  nucleic acid-binding Zn-ribbon protein